MCDLLRINTDRGVMIEDGKTRFSKNGNPIFHFLGTSTFSEFTVVHVGCVAKINPSAPLDIVCVLCLMRGATRIIGVDLNASRFDQAKKFGVTECLNPKDHNKLIQKVIAEMTDGGVDRSVECTGNVNAMISAFECVHGWGVAVLVGVPNKDDEFKTHPAKFLNETFFGNYKPKSDIPSVVETLYFLSTNV